jgi:hypothetical protein
MAIEEQKREMGSAWMTSSWEIASPWVKDRLRIKALSKALETSGLALLTIGVDATRSAFDDNPETLSASLTRVGNAIAKLREGSDA